MKEKRQTAFARQTHSIVSWDLQDGIRYGGSYDGFAQLTAHRPIDIYITNSVNTH